MQPDKHFSALSSWVLLIAKAIDSYGFDSRELFTKVGLDHRKLRDPVARFSFPSVSRLWALAAETTRDSCFGLTVAGFWHPTTLHALGYSWLASSNLEEALARAVRYSRIVNTAASGVLRMQESEADYCLIIDVGDLNPHPVSIDAALAMLLIMCRAACGETFRPLRVSLQRDRPGDAHRFSDLFKAPVNFRQEKNAMWLDPQDLIEPLVTANPELVRVNEQIVIDYLAQLDRSDLSMRVQAELIERLPNGQVDEEEIASSIHVSRRSLQRKLREQGVSFTQLLDNTRRDLSLQYVRDPQHSFNEIAFLLGFSEPANFSRAFKRWYGKSPSLFRQDSLS
jgi:AraC-like DNA-binding protein